MISSKNSMREGSIRVPQREPFFAAYYRVMSSLCKMCDVLRSSLTSRAWPRSSSNHTWKNGKDKSPLRGGAGVGMPAIVGIISGKIAEERGGEFSRVNQRGQLLLDNFSKQQWCKGCIKLPSSLPWYELWKGGAPCGLPDANENSFLFIYWMRATLT